MAKQHGALILARYSTENQNEDTIETQIDTCTKYCSEHNIPVLDVFADLAISGMKRTRPEYERMMQSIRDGIGDTVVIYDQSRMFRSLTAWFQFREELQALGATVISVTQSFVGGDINDPSVFMAEGVTAVFNQLWVLQTRQKVLADKTRKAQQGKHLGGRPALGYRKNDEGYLEIEPEEAETVRMIYQWYDDGMSYTEIIDKLNSLGRTNKIGKPFGKNSLHDLLKNEKYTGVVISRNYKTTPSGGHTRHGADSANAIRVEGACPAIVSREQWQRVQKRMAGNIHAGTHAPQVVNQPLKGKVYCASCGSGMSLSSSKVPRGTGRYYYYKCNAQKSKREDCKNKPIRKELLESVVAAQIRETVSDPGFAEKIRAALKSRQDIDQTSDKLEQLRREKSEIERKINNGMDAILEGMASQKLKDRIAQLEHRADVIDAEMSNLENSRTEGITDQEIDLYVREVEKFQAASDAALLSIVARVEVGEDAITVYTIYDRPPDKYKEIDIIAQASEDVSTSSGHSIWRTIILSQHVIAIMMRSELTRGRP